MAAPVLDRSAPPTPGPIRPYDFPRIERHRLSNGLPVYFSETSGSGIATVSLLLPAGALREADEKAGLARLTNSLLESGTGDLSAEQIAERLERNGVHLSTGCGWEMSNIDFTCLSEHVATSADLIRGMVREPSFPVDEVDRLRKQQIAGIVQRRSQPSSYANELIKRYIFAPTSPFGRPISGEPETVEPLTRDDVTDFHSQVYTPDQAGIVAVGRIDRDAFLRAAEQHYGDWKGQPARPIEPSVEARFPVGRTIIVDRPGAVQSEIRIGHLGATRDTTDYFAILVMNTILGGAFTSRLNLNLREKNGYTYGARSRFIMRREPGPFLVSTAVQTEVTAAAVREIHSELERMREAAPTDSELEDARQYVAGTFPLRLETTDAIATRLAELFIYDLPDRYVSEFPERILEVTDEQVLRAARTYIRPSRAITLVLGDAEKVESELRELDISEVEVIRAENGQ